MSEKTETVERQLELNHDGHESYLISKAVMSSLYPTIWTTHSMVPRAAMFPDIIPTLLNQMSQHSAEATSGSSSDGFADFFTEAILDSRQELEVRVSRT